MGAEKKIKKHVSIIHAYSLMTILQRKILNALLYEAVNGNLAAHNYNSTFSELRIPLSKISKVINYNSNNSKYLKESIDSLASIKIEWNLLKDKVPCDISFLNLRILHGAPTFYQDNTFSFAFHKILMDLMINSTIYGTIDLNLQSLFESKYSHSLYENCTRFVNMQKSKIIEIDIFKKLIGIPNNSYSNISELMRNTIKPSVEEVNDRADFSLYLNNIRAGRKIIGFNVEVSSKKIIKKIKKIPYTLEEEILIENIKKNFGEINHSALKYILKNYDIKYINEKMSYTKFHTKKEKNDFYPFPYFMSALKYNYSTGIQKSKEAVVNESTTTQSGLASDWKHNLLLLESDLIHWKERLHHFKLSGDQIQIKNITAIILRCEEKLQLHLASKQTERDIE